MENPNQSTGGLLSPSSWWLNQPHLKNMLIKMGEPKYPKVRGENKKLFETTNQLCIFLDVGFLKEVERREPGLGPEGRCESANTSMI